MSGAMSAPGMPGGGLPSAPPGGQPQMPGLPPGMAPPRPNVGATQPQANAGNVGAAVLDIRNGLQFLQRALPNLPMGSPLHADVLSCVSKLSKHAGEEAPLSLINQSAMSMVRDRSQNPLAAQMAKMFPAGGGQEGPAMPAPTEAA